MGKIAFIFEEKGEYAPREGYEVVKRNNIAAIIKYQKEILLLNYNNVNYSMSLVTGGVEDGEEMLDAVRREVIEETGYSDIKSVTPIDCINISRFFVEHKNQNREATYYPFLVILNSKDRIEIAKEEANEHKCVWVPIEDLEATNIFDNHRQMINAAIKE